MICDVELMGGAQSPRNSDNTTTANSDRAFYYYCNIYFLLILSIAITSQVAVSCQINDLSFFDFLPVECKYGEFSRILR